MSKTKRPHHKAPRTSAVLFTMVLAAAVVAGLAAYVKLTPADKVPENLRRPNESARNQGSSGPATRVQQHATVIVPRPVFDGEILRFEAEPIDVPPSVDPKVAAVNGFLRVSGIAEPSAEVLGVDVRQGTAFLDFNDAFQAGMGSMDEATLINGLRATLGQFSDVLRIELFVNGERIQELGHLDLSEPQGVIRRDDWTPKPDEIPPTAPTG